jgi:hypothetical protein
VDAAFTFTPGTDSLGDPIEEVTLSFSTNIPVPAAVYPALSVGRLTLDATCFCPVPKGGRDQRQWRFKGSAPKGLYRAVLFVPSYTDYADFSLSATPQLPEYQNWAGKLGAGLPGNPLAVRDPKHPAILNLQREITVSH